MIRRLAPAALLVVAGGACGSGAAPRVPPDAVVDTTLPVVRLQPQAASPFSYLSGLTAPSRTVIRTATAWADEWATITQRRQPAPPLPPIDFTQEMIIVAAMGQRPSGGYAIFIDRVNQAADGSIDVVVRSVSPGSLCITTQSLTQPVDVARVPQRDGAVRFTEVAQTRAC